MYYKYREVGGGEKNMKVCLKIYLHYAEIHCNLRTSEDINIFS